MVDLDDPPAGDFDIADEVAMQAPPRSTMVIAAAPDAAMALARNLHWR
jgi:hypothetical protein